jgi:small subunit ribosomal protein S5
MAQTRRDDRDRGRDRDERDSEFVDKLVHINRVGKAREVPEAIRKATEAAKRDMIFVPLRSGRTLHHDVHGRWGAGRVLLRAAKAGTGIIAGGPMRAVFETLGMQDVVAKSMGSSNPYNMVRATFEALKGQLHPKDVAAQRGIKYSTLQARRGSAVTADE